MFTQKVIRHPLVVLTIIVALLSTGCSSLPKVSIGDKGVKIKVTSVPLKIALAAGTAALQVASDEYLGMDIDMQALLEQIVEVPQARRGMPPQDVATVMVVNKQTNDILYWRLTDKVKMIRLKHQSPGEIELKVANDTPLRIELWMEGGLEDIDVVVEMKS